MSPRRLALVLGGAVVLVHLLLALGAFNPAPHTGGDNAGYIALAHALLETGSYTDLSDPAGLAYTKYPPVFPLLLAVWIAAGATTWTALKTVALVSSAAGVLFAFLWASGRRGPVFGAAVALLVGLASATIEHSHWILSDATFVALTLAALWAFDRAGGRAHGEGGPGVAPEAAAARERRPGVTPEAAAVAQARPGAWLALGIVAALLACFTRSAGLPLVVALGAWLAWHRRWRTLALTAVAAGGPLLLWWLRSRAVGEATYSAEFWLENPYDPSLGTVGVGGLLARVGVNAVGYVTRHLPGGVVGAQGAWVVAFGVGLVGLALWGWGRRIRETPGVAELFVPAYLGLVLLWPAVWSGDRFALPLYAPLFLYAGDALLGFGRRHGRATAVTLALAALLIAAAPAFAAWTRSVGVARICRTAARSAGPFACWGRGVDEYVRMALWSRTALPEGSAVLSRKPRIFYVMSGVPSRTFPFSLEPDALLNEARATGARYVVVDQWDQQALLYVGEAVALRPQAFCTVGGFDPRAGAAGTLLLGILLDAPGGDDIPGTQIELTRCPPEMLGDADPQIPAYTSPEVPLLSSSSASSARVP